MIETLLIIFVMVSIPVGIVLGLVLAYYWKRQSKSFSVGMNLHNLVLKGAEYLSPSLMQFLVNHHSVLQFVEFGFVGALGVGVNALVYFSTTPYIGNNPAWFLGIFSAFISNFFLNKYLVFNDAD